MTDLHPSQTAYSTPQLSRRGFLTKSTTAAAAVGVASFTSARLAFATPDDPSLGDAVVLIFLRGGMDGLNLVPPHGYASYRQLRPNIAIPGPGAAGGALPLTPASSNNTARFSGGFEGGVVGLHPALQPVWETLWREGSLAIIPGVGTDENRTRSHFEAQDLWERGGGTATSVRSGFLDRMLRLQGASGGLAGVSMSNSLPYSLRGTSGSVTVSNLSRVGLNGFGRGNLAFDALQSLYEGAGVLEDVGQRALGVVSDLQALADDASSRPGYPDGGFGSDLSDIAVLLGSSIGLRAAAVSLGGWDTHSNQGRGDDGRFWNRVQELAAGLRAFTDDLKSTGAYDETTIIVLTEFGRTINENGSRGTDHGRATSIMMMGGGIRGGVYGYDYYDQIADDSRYGDLTVLTDWRDPVSQVLQARTGVDPTQLFPTLSPGSSLGLV